jgi:hypothetical protein
MTDHVTGVYYMVTSPTNSQIIAITTAARKNKATSATQLELVVGLRVEGSGYMEQRYIQDMTLDRDLRAMECNNVYSLILLTHIRCDDLM